MQKHGLDFRAVVRPKKNIGREAVTFDSQKSSSLHRHVNERKKFGTRHRHGVAHHVFWRRTDREAMQTGIEFTRKGFIYPESGRLQTHEVNKIDVDVRNFVAPFLRSHHRTERLHIGPPETYLRKHQHRQQMVLDLKMDIIRGSCSPDLQPREIHVFSRFEFRKHYDIAHSNPET